MQLGLWTIAAALNAGTVAWLAWAVASPPAAPVVDDADLPEVSPPAVQPASPAFPPLAEYDRLWDAAAGEVPPEQPQPLADASLRLMAIAVEDGHTYAVFLDQQDMQVKVCREGETFDGVSVTSIEVDRVHIRRGGRAFVMELPRERHEEAGS